MKKEQHVIVEKRFIFNMPRTSPRERIGTKEMKRAKREVEIQYGQWLKGYMKKRGVIGPDGHPTATVPRLTKNKWTIEIGMKVDFIVHRRRAQMESFLRHAHPKSWAIKVMGMEKKT